LKKLLPDMKYTGLDIGGNPDIRLDLEKVERLPFDNSSYDCVICVDVLEHLDNLHHIFGEVIRVAKKNLIISFPNCWAVARKPIRRGKGSFAHYGLPNEPPTDRHKWFFNLSQAREFVLKQARRYGISIVEFHATEKPRLGFVRALRKVRYPKQEWYLNRYANTLWVVFEKE
jgi:SAM-dependent methyltransferase